MKNADEKAAEEKKNADEKEAEEKKNSAELKAIKENGVGNASAQYLTLSDRLALGKKLYGSK